MSPSRDYIAKCRGLADTVDAQIDAIQQAAEWFTESILARMLSVNHSAAC